MTRNSTAKPVFKSFSQLQMEAMLREKQVNEAKAANYKPASKKKLASLVAYYASRRS
jgi:hypothetical protein